MPRRSSGLLELEGSRILDTAEFTEVASNDVPVEPVELGMAQGVERLGTELEARALGERERLVEVDGEVRLARASYGVSTRVAKADVKAGKLNGA